MVAQNRLHWIQHKRLFHLKELASREIKPEDVAAVIEKEVTARQPHLSPDFMEVTAPGSRKCR
jgi:hypothetical protein